MNKNKTKANAKRAAFAQKKEQEGRKVINWIFAVLVLLGVIYAVYSMMILG
ncbi:MAG: hypothetical protein J6B33_01330 [Prevotella sp.]|nr:hypothetical protein [Prevotella sp.]